MTHLIFMFVQIDLHRLDYYDFSELIGWIISMTLHLGHRAFQQEIMNILPSCKSVIVMLLGPKEPVVSSTLYVWPLGNEIIPWAPENTVIPCRGIFPIWIPFASFAVYVRAIVPKVICSFSPYSESLKITVNLMVGNHLLLTSWMLRLCSAGSCWGLGWMTVGNNELEQ